MIRRTWIVAATCTAVLAGGLAAIASPAQANGQGPEYVVNVTTNPLAPGARAEVSVLDQNGNVWSAYSNNLQGGTGTVNVDFWDNPGPFPQYILSVLPPTGTNPDDSAPYLALGDFPTRSENSSTAVSPAPAVFPAPNIVYTIKNDAGIAVVQGATVRFERPRFNNQGYSMGSSSIFGALTDSAGKVSANLVEGNLPINATPGRGWRVVVTPPTGSGLAPLTFDDSLGGSSSVMREIRLKKANIVAVIVGPDGNPYRGANVSIETLPDQWCNSRQILWTQVNGDPGNSLDDTLMAYTDGSLTPDGFRLTLRPGWRDSGEDSSVVPTEFDLPLTWLNEDSVRTLQYQAPDLTVTLMKSDGSGPLANASVSVSRLKSNGEPGCDRRNSTTDPAGKAYFNVDDTGLYRFEINPPENSSELRQRFVVPGAQLAGGQLVLNLRGANITGTVDDSAGNPLSNAKVTFQSLSSEGWLYDYLGDVRTDPSGTYRFVLDPSLIPYGVAVTAEPSNGWASGVATRVTVKPSELPADGQPALDRDIQLNVANFVGTILNSAGNPLTNAWVNGNMADGTSLAGVQTDSSGRFAMNVPTAISETSPLRLGVWLQDEQRYVQRTVTQLSTDFEWRVPSVNLEVVVTAGGDPAARAQVNLMKFNGAFDEWIDGGQTGEDGIARFAVDDTTIEYVVEVQPEPEERDFATTRRTAVGLPNPNVAGSAIIEVALDEPNAAVQVVGPGEDGLLDPLPNAWVWIRGLDDFNGTGSNTGEDGVARLNLADTSGLFEVNVSPPYQFRQQLTSTRVEAEFQTVAGVPVPIIQVELAEPNVRLQVVRPGTNPVEGLRYAQLELRREGEPWGFSWMGTDEQGRVGLDLADGAYDVIVRPSTWEVGMSGFGASKYSLRVSGDNVSVSEQDRNGPPARVSGGYYQLEPSEANVAGVVQAPTTPPSNVANSWVSVMKEMTDGTNTWYEWVEGSSTSRDGTFGMTLPDDTYVLSAEPVWGDRTYAPSEPCYLVVSGGSRLPAGSGPAGQCDDTLTLRAPNLAFTVMNPITGQPAVGAWACPLNTGNWNCVGSGRDGKVTFFVDDTESIVGPDIRIQIEAPWGSSGLASRTITIAKTQVGTSAYTDGSYQVSLATPNVRIRVWKDDTTPGNEMAEGWVSLVSDDNNFNWVAGSGVSRQGLASFNLDDTSAPFCIDAWPGWSLRNSYGPVQMCGVDLASGALDLVFRSANVKATVEDASGRPNAFGWVEISDGIVQRGASLDERGRLATYLPDGDYVFTLYPGWLRSGTPTNVEVRVRGGVPAPSIESPFRLEAGNVSGRVTVGGAATPGVLVTATSAAGVRKTAVTDDEGLFRISLSPGTYVISTLLPPGTSGTAAISGLSGASLSGSTLTVGS